MNNETKVEIKTPEIQVDKSLNKYDGVVLFPKKVAKAKEAFEKYGIPDMDKIHEKKKEKA